MWRKCSSEASHKPSHEVNSHLKVHMNLFLYMKVHVKVQNRFQLRVHNGCGPISHHPNILQLSEPTIYQCQKNCMIDSFWFKRLLIWPKKIQVFMVTDINLWPPTFCSYLLILPPVPYSFSYLLLLPYASFSCYPFCGFAIWLIIGTKASHQYFR